MATGIDSNSSDLAQDLFEILTQVSLSTQPQHRRELDLKELEFLTLSILHHHQPMIVGKIQKMLGVLPAQMSRIIRGLEGREPPFISCEINANDKRKVDVRLTGSGTQALIDYQEARVGRLSDLLATANDSEKQELSSLVRKLSGIFDRTSPPLKGPHHKNLTDSNVHH